MTKQPILKDWLNSDISSFEQLWPTLESLHEAYGNPELKRILRISQKPEGANVSLLFLLADFLIVIDEPCCLGKLVDLCSSINLKEKDQIFWSTGFSLLAQCKSEFLPESKEILSFQNYPGMNTVQKAFSEYLAALFQFRSGRFVRALDPLDKVLNILKKQPFSILEVWSHSLRAIIEKECDQIHSAISSCLSAIQIARTNGFTSRLCEIGNQSALLYLSIDDQNHSREMLRTSLHYSDQVGSEYLRACTYLNLAADKMYEGDLDGALEDLKICVSTFKSLHSQEKLAFAYFDCFRCYQSKGQADHCDSILREIELCIEGMSDVEDLRFKVIRARSEMELQTQNFQAALKLVEESLSERRHLRESIGYGALERFRSNLIIRKLIVDHDLIPATRLAMAEAEAQRLDVSIPSILVKSHELMPTDYCHLLIEKFGYQVPEPQDYRLVTSDLQEIISFRFAQDHNILPIGIGDGVFTIIVSDPLDEKTIRAVGVLSEMEVQVKIADPEILAVRISECYSIQSQSLFHEDYPVFLENILNLANRFGVSDIHIFPDKDHTGVQFRIDGVMQHVEHFSKDHHSPLVNVIKLWAELDLAIHSIPQDGRFEYGRFAYRVSTAPMLHGEKTVLRLISGTMPHLELLGIEESILRDVLKVSQRSGGMFLVTGPTGSGKTSTLYAILNELNDYKRSILTVEDPVENDLKNIAQSQVNRSKGYTFNSALACFLRQDPDVILVGEIRDEETAQIAVRASLTGIMVFSTLHTYNTYSTINRLKDLGTSPYLLAESVHGILCQRLVRSLCARCKKISEPDIEKYYQFREYLEELRGLESFSIFSPMGCNHCQKLGYRGRTLICEWLPIDQSSRDLILNSAQLDQFEAHFKEQNLISLAHSGFLKVLRGETTFQEVMRVL